jgi:hypothetical protein
MDLANMRQNGVRSLLVMCFGCRHEVIGDPQRRSVSRRSSGSRVRAAHGVHQMRHGRRRRPAELERTGEVTAPIRGNLMRAGILIAAVLPNRLIAVFLRLDGLWEVDTRAGSSGQ